jgi:hypothetical protein
MNVMNYFCHIIGESPRRLGNLHASTISRIKAFAIAIHIPVLMWGLSGYVLSAEVFGLSPAHSAGVALACALLIYLVERLVLATPKAWYISVGRVGIGLVIALLGASMVDLIIFEREVSHQLRQTAAAELGTQHERAVDAQTRAVEQAKTDWFAAREAANCEANGRCGSGLRNVGPVYRELAAQAEVLRADYDAAQAKLESLKVAQARELEELYASPLVLQRAGLLSRIEALHQYTLSNPVAFAGWVLFFTLMLFFELMVVLVKLVFGTTVDDQIEAIRERISHEKATAYLAAVSSPVGRARQLADASYV